MNEWPETRWLIVGLPDGRRVSIVLTLDTTAPEIVGLIEDAAMVHGVKLQRIGQVS